MSHVSSYIDNGALCAFIKSMGGAIKIDGINIKDYKRSAIRKQIGMVLQDTWLYNGSIAGNIAFGNEDATMDEIVQAAKEAHAYHFIRTLPEEYDTVLNEEGTNFHKIKNN